MENSTGSTVQSAPVVAAEIYRINQPLKTPYHLAFGSFDAFDTFLAHLRTEDGRSAWGETTACPGYVPETGDEIWDLLCTHTPTLVGSDPTEQVNRLLPFTISHPYAAAPLVTALERLDVSQGDVDRGRDAPPGSAGGSSARGRAGRLPALPVNKAIVPLVGILSGDGEKELEASFWDRVKSGHKTVKLKVGFDLYRDVERAKLVQRLALETPGVRMRIDANQGYSLEEASIFVRGLDPAYVELFEQPFGIGDWDSQAALAPVSPVPLMLDESILSNADVERAATLKCAHYVKFKLMKAGGAGRLVEQIGTAQRLGLKVVLGNGVSGEIGNYHEAIASLRAGLDTAGEMNGFLKLQSSVLSEPLAFENGGIVVRSGFDPTPAVERLVEIAVNHNKYV